MSTDLEWEQWGARDPYFGVLTHARFRSAALDEAARLEFFESGQQHVRFVLETCHQRVQSGFVPTRVLDFGCGVGRLVLPFARVAREVVGVDVSQSMLREARRNVDAAGLHNVVLAASDDQLSAVEGVFDLVHSCIVIQHIEVARGLVLFRELVRRVAPGGLGAIQITFAWDIHVANHGLPPQPQQQTAWQGWLRASRDLLRSCVAGNGSGRASASNAGDPEMQMNFYNLSQLMFLLQQAGVSEVHSQLTNHGGAMGAFLFFRQPAGASAASVTPFAAATPHAPAPAPSAAPSAQLPPALPFRLPAAAPRQCVAGQTFTIEVDCTGPTTDLHAVDDCVRAAAPLALSYHWRRPDGSLDTWDGLRTPLPADAAASARRVALQIAAPQRPGRYALELSALREGLHWFEDLGATPLTLDYEVVEAPAGLSNT